MRVRRAQMDLTDEAKKALAEEVEIFEHRKDYMDGGPLCRLWPIVCTGCPYVVSFGGRCIDIWEDFPDDDDYKLLVAYTLADMCGVKMK
jgi:hypothetical protein